MMTFPRKVSQRGARQESCLYKVGIMSNFHLKLLQMAITHHFLVWASSLTAQFS